MGGMWPYNYCFMGCFFQALFSIACSILEQFPYSFFRTRIVSIDVVYSYNSIDMTTISENPILILSDRSDLYRFNSLSIAIQAYSRCVLTSLSEDEIILLRYVNLFTNFRGPPFRVVMTPLRSKHKHSVLWSMLPVVCSRLCSRDSAWVGIFARSAISSA